MIEIQHASKTFYTKTRKVEALQDVSLKIEDGEIFGVIGFSGAGKSTLIRCMNLLERPDSGKVLVNGKDLMTLSKGDLRKERKNIGMIFQQFNLLGSKTVYQNLAIPLILEKVPKADIKERVHKLLEFVELEDKMDTYASQLSGGQKQRVGIARALATNPSILLCDEATSALDPKTTESILQLLQKVNRELGVTVVLITHEMNVIKKICGRVAVMENGKIVEQGNVFDVFGNPQCQVTKGFVETVIDDTIPSSILETLKHSDENFKLLRLKFTGKQAHDALLSQASKDFDVLIAILYATVHELQGTLLSLLVVKVAGSDAEIAKAEAYLKDSGVEVQEVTLD